MLRQVEESADAASQSLTRFFVNGQLSDQEVRDILGGFTKLSSLLALEQIANPNLAPESVVEDLLTRMPCPQALRQTRQDAVYRVALHSVVQTLMLVGRVMGQWQTVNFSSTFELPRRVVEQLNVISDQMNALGASGQDAADRRFELIYRDYLLQRFHRVEAGTVKMTTNMNIDLRELFVMPRVLVRPQRKKKSGALVAESDPLSLALAREIFGQAIETAPESAQKKTKDRSIKALKQVKRKLRNVIVGLPGSGKSTLFEWLQLQVAAVETAYPLGGEQAIPLLLRVRQLNPKTLPTEAAMIEKATASSDHAALMPEGWVERQMTAGRVLFMLDGLDETEPELCDDYILPWLAQLCEKYPGCAYLVSSRPVGYPQGALRSLRFTESDLQNFEDAEIAEYVRHWCVARRLAQDEPEAEARREGAAEGAAIVNDFNRNPYVRNLAQNPLMLSAICLVNYFERGKLPEDRAVLYKLCVEGLLHHWDSRRGIHSEFTLEEKLRTCREVALAMQAEERAEYEAKRVERIFSVTLGDPDRARKLLEHIRYRSGLLIERRAGMFAFTHLTFQEYLAAQAVYEGNHLEIDAKQLAKEHNDGRWKEVIALYCGDASASEARKMINRLIEQPDTIELSEVLAEAYFSSGPKLAQDKNLRQKVIERLAVAPFKRESQLGRFSADEVAPIANLFVGKSRNEDTGSESYFWLHGHAQYMDEPTLLDTLQGWRRLHPMQIGEIIYLLHRRGSSEALQWIAKNKDIYESPGPKFWIGEIYSTQAEMALLGLLGRGGWDAGLPNIQKSFIQILRVLIAYADSELPKRAFGFRVNRSLTAIRQSFTTANESLRLELISLLRQWIEKLGRSHHESRSAYFEEAIQALREWADELEQSSSDKAKPANTTKPQPATAAKRAAKKTAKRR